MKYLLTLIWIVFVGSVALSNDPTYVLSNGVVSRIDAPLTATTNPVVDPLCPDGNCPPPLASIVSAPTRITVPAGYHAHQTVDGKTIVHGDWNNGSSAAHAGAVGYPNGRGGMTYPKVAYAGQTVTVNLPQALSTVPVASPQVCPTCPKAVGATFPLPMTGASPPTILLGPTGVSTGMPVRGFFQGLFHRLSNRPRLFLGRFSCP